MNVGAQALVDDVENLISLPELVIKINEMVNSESANAAEIGRLISHDPALSSAILRVANSSMYANVGQVESITRAVTILGTKQIRDLVLSATAAKVFDGIPNDVVSVEDFWHHSLYCALLARALARHSKGVDAETMFTAGLLHDIGHLVMFHRQPEQAHAAILRTVQGEAAVELYQAEKDILGYTHCDVGESLARHWRLPDVLIQCIASHHDLKTAGAFTRPVAHIHIANAIASLPYSDIPTPEELSRVHPEAWEMSGLSAGDLAEAIDEARAGFDEARAALFGESVG